MPTGPYLQAALFCERVLKEGDGVLSIIRVIDRVVQTAGGSNVPEKMPPLNYGLTALIMLKSGQASGSVQVGMSVEQPSGLTKDAASMSVLMEGGERGQNLVVQMQMTFEEPGLYWFNVMIENECVTRMPLRVVYTRIAGPAPQ